MSPETEPQEPLSVVLLYAPEDETLARELIRQFETVRTSVRVFHPSAIPAGESIPERASDEINRADVILLFLSADFVANEACAKSLHHALACREHAGARIIPVQVRPVAALPSELCDLQMVPRDGGPISGRTQKQREKEWVRLVQELRSESRAAGPRLRPSREDVELFQEVLRFCRLDHEASGARIEHTLRVVDPPLWQLAEVIAVRSGKPKTALLLATVRGVPDDSHLAALRPWKEAHRKRHPFAIAQLVHDGPAPGEALVNAAYDEGVHLVSLAEYQRIIDVEPYVERLLARLLRDPLYPPALYVPQRGQWMRGDEQILPDVLARLEEALLTPDQRFIVVLGDFGTGKTFLLKRLAARLAERKKPPYPVLVEMRALEKVHSVDALVAQHFANEKRPFFPEAFREMLRAGQIALLFDGFDELALRVRYARAAEHLEMLIGAAEGRAKLVLTSRTQHFSSDQQVRTALAERADRVPGREMLKLHSFDHAQIERFLQNKLSDVGQATARVQLLDQVKDLLGLSTNPRMLSFIADLPETELLEARDRRQEITAASLYRRLLDHWFAQEDERLRLHNETDKLRPEERWGAVESLALHLWGRSVRTLDIRELPAEVSRVLGDLSARDLDKDIAAHQVGTATLLVREGEERLAFLHQSVMEWLVANAAATASKRGEVPEILEKGEMTALMADFFLDLASSDMAVAWAKGIAQGTAGDQAKRNALLVLRRAGADMGRANYAGQDLRGQALSWQDLSYADFTGADLSDARLAGAKLERAIFRNARLVNANLEMAVLTSADLTSADLSRARMMGADLRGADIARSTWHRAKIAGVRLDPEAKALIEEQLGGEPSPQPRLQVLANAAKSAFRAIALHGDLLATGHADGSVLLWDAAARAVVRVLWVPHEDVSGVTFSADGKRLAASASDGSVSVWETSSGDLLCVSRHQVSAGVCIALSPDGTTLAAADSFSHTVCLVDVITGNLLHRWTHPDPVSDLAFSPDGQSLASAGANGLVSLWNIGTGRVALPLGAGSRSAQCLAFSPDGLRLIVGYKDGTIVRWETATGALVEKALVDSVSIRRVILCPDGHALAVGHDGQSLRVWHSSSPAQSRELAFRPWSANTVALGAGGLTIAFVAIDGSLKLWDEPSRKVRSQLASPSGGPELGTSCVAFAPDGATLASGAFDGRLWLWDRRGGTGVSLLEPNKATPVLGIAYSPDGRTLAARSRKTIELWDARASRPTGTLVTDADGPTSLAFSPDGRLLVSGLESGNVDVWHPSVQVRHSRLAGHSNPVIGVAFSPGGHVLVSVSIEGWTQVWETESWSRVCSWIEPSGARSLAFDADGLFVALGLSNGRVSLRRVATATSSHWLEHGHGSVDAVAFSPDRLTFASGASDGNVTLWDWRRGRVLRALPGHAGPIRSVAFHPSGRLLAAACGDASIHLWRVADGARMAVLCPTPTGWVFYEPGGRYKFGGSLHGFFWHVLGLCRYEVGELDPYLPGLRMPDDEPFFELPEEAPAP